MTATTQGAKYQIMPDMSSEEYALLKEDIRTNGVKLAIEFDEDGNILDGHHRWRAFSELIDEGVDVPMPDKIIRKFTTEEEKWAHVISLNMKRRHLTAEQRQQVVLQLRMPPFNYTMTRIAELMGVGVATVWRDIDDAPDELREELKALQVRGADGFVRTSTYAPRMFFTGETQLRQMEAQLLGEAKAAAQTSNGTAQGGVGEAPNSAATTPNGHTGITPVSLHITTTKYGILVNCKDEAEQAELLDRLIEEGYDVKALTL